MKVLLLASGRSYHATRWANALAERGVEIGFATVHKVERPLSDRVRVFPLSQRGAKGYLLEAPKLRALLRLWQPDILHAHYATGYGLMSRLTGFVPRIVSIYGSDIYDFPQRSALHRALLGYVLRGARVLSTSAAMADEYQRCFPGRARPQETPFGVDLALFRPNPAGLAAQPGQCHIGIVKKLEQTYGIDVLLQAFARLRSMAAGPGAHLHIVGDGSQATALRTQAQQLGLGEAVTFYGAIPNREVPAFLHRMDLFVVPSRSESFGVAAVEAQACALPVVATAVGGLPEVVANGLTGLIVPPEDAVALADALAELCADAPRRLACGQAARRRVEQRYSWNSNVGHLIDIYRATLGR